MRCFAIGVFHLSSIEQTESCTLLFLANSLVAGRKSDYKTYEVLTIR